MSINKNLSRREIENGFNNTMRRIIAQLRQFNYDCADLKRVARVYDSFAQADESASICLMGPFVMLFENDILARNEKALFEFPYQQYVFEDCENNTREFIEGLIDLCKNTWAMWVKDDDSVNQNTFRKSILELYIYSSMYGCPKQQIFKFDAVKDKLL